ncbi:type II secretion system protein N [Sphingobium subterraneum]|uniref:General secretion pathway protein C n=1 Tax=Sphingobium subterraneum TaxID=627688 RepID=A0A841IWF7_9SPHN|nr:type II secretion system protein N [Sphingobium subterraneum]MBB6122694.1 general secretion pathway protein C [Sphingobium subterraneum]
MGMASDGRERFSLWRRAAGSAAARKRGGDLATLEWLLLAVVAVQAARLLWVVVTPVSPLPQWRAAQATLMPTEARMALFRGFDPFNAQSAAAGPANQTVTSLALVLYGVRVNEGSGQGSAILAGPDGQQQSFAIGDEVLPGVTLKAVAFDHVTIDRGGREETVFLDQSRPIDPVQAGPVDPGAAGATAPVPAGTVAPSPVRPPPVAGGNSQPTMSRDAEIFRSSIGFGMQQSTGRTRGITVNAQGPAFASSGLRAGDVITRINGREVVAADDLGALQQAMVPGARINVTVDRGGKSVPVTLAVPGS